MKKRRLLSLILTICMVLSLTPMVAYADIQIFTKGFVVMFNPGGVDEQTEGKVQVQIGDGEPWFAEAWNDYDYEDGNTPITFTLTPPAEGVGYTPVVIVMDGTTYTVQPELQQSEGKYSFTIAPNAISGNSDLPFVVHVSWCWEYDSFGPEDGQFMVETHVRGGDANGTLLIQPGPEEHKSFGSNDKYTYNRNDDVNKLYVTFIPQPGMKLAAFRIGDQVYGDEPVDGFSEEEMQPLPELSIDGQCMMTISVPALSDTDAEEYIFVEAIFEGAYPVAPPAGLRWDGKIAKWDAVEGADHYRVTLMTGFSDDNGEIFWAAAANSGVITDTCELDFSNRISSSDDSVKYCFRVCAIKDKVCSDEVESIPYAEVEDAGDIPSYSIIEGANGVWTQNSDETLAFRANGDFSKFTGVKVDDTLIDAKNYTAASGSTVIPLTTDYLETLSVSTHKLTVVYNDGECSTNFEVKAASEQTKPTEGDKTDTTNPQTGDNNMMGLWIALLFVYGAGVAGTTIYSRKKKYSAK